MRADTFNTLADCLDDIVLNPTAEELQYLQDHYCKACGSLTHREDECQQPQTQVKEIESC